MPDPYGYLRSCGGCSAHLLTYRSADGATAYCPKCEKGLMDAEEQLAEARPVLHLFGESTAREFILIERDGDMLAVRPLGQPDVEPMKVSIGQVRRRFSYAKLNRVLASERRAKARRKAGQS